MEYAVWFYAVGTGGRRFFNTYAEIALALETVEKLLALDWIEAAVIVRQTAQVPTTPVIAPCCVTPEGA